MKNIMKYAFFGGLCFVVAAAQGCGDDDPPPPSTTVTSSSSGNGGAGGDPSEGGSGGDGATGGTGGTAPANTYQTLATVLTADWLVVNLEGADDSAGYLGAETKILDPTAADSTGGRTLSDDVINADYGPVLTGAAGLGDGDIAELNGPTETPLADFPYMPAALP